LGGAANQVHSTLRQGIYLPLANNPPEAPLCPMCRSRPIAILGIPYCRKWEAILLENWRRFAAGRPLLKVVDQEK
jgi:hypothetical protein